MIKWIRCIKTYFTKALSLIRLFINFCSCNTTVLSRSKKPKARSYCWPCVMIQFKKSNTFLLVAFLLITIFTLSCGIILFGDSAWWCSTHHQVLHKFFHQDLSCRFHSRSIGMIAMLSATVRVFIIIDKAKIIVRDSM